MTPVAEVATVILPMLFPELKKEPFFPYTVPERYQSFKEVPYFKIESISDQNTAHGSDKYHSRSYRLQVMAFIDLEKTDIEELTDTLDRGMEESGFIQTYGEDKPHTENKKIHVVIRQYITSRRK
ncbi:hypothetical protein [Enterococcus sp. BWR-S5]|uniref:hypothetical protein n=1 Tax=Enterococcus sp. BWR-S5 TaxID=2787714 RepID=UPI0019233B61|nr:hypothetical protein [Enterococcus sp. BWR-S5]MBL1224791.1 hypothetical protein [Enterococcus sp. BWR-S5]